MPHKLRRAAGSRSSPWSQPLVLALALAAASVTVGGGCFVQQRRDAACEQLIVASCAARAHCGGVDAATCEGEQRERVCNESPEDARTCIAALNPLLVDACTQLPGELPCPADLLTSGVYDSCVIDAECSAPQIALGCIDGLCSQACNDVETLCPEQGACNTTARRCEEHCDDTTQPCASGLQCIEERCLTCEEACVDKSCGSGTTCECGRCVATTCDSGSDCPNDFGCLDGSCAACLRDAQDDCIPCTSNFDCNQGLCADGGLCV